jgi:type IV pilus assembly protein PilW
MKTLSLRSRSRGISLIEILISLVIGLVIVGAVLISMIGSGKAGRYQAAYTQMNEDAQIAFSILSRDLQLAGYSAPTGLSAGPAPQTLTFNALAGTNYIFGCDTRFANAQSVPLVCGAVVGAGAQAAFEVAYQADLRTTAPQGGGAGVPSDCLGNQITPVGGIYIARNRYFLSTGNSQRPELSCTSANATAGPQPLVENIQEMAILYGVAVTAAPTQVVRYVTATQVSAVGPAEWQNVISVRVCLIVRSSDPVLDNGEDSPAYRDCAGALQTPTDRYLRRAYFTTAAIRDKMP